MPEAQRGPAEVGLSPPTARRAVSPASHGGALDHSPQLLVPWLLRRCSELLALLLGTLAIGGRARRMAGVARRTLCGCMSWAWTTTTPWSSMRPGSDLSSQPILCRSIYIYYNYNITTLRYFIYCSIYILCLCYSLFRVSWEYPYIWPVFL